MPNLRSAFIESLYFEFKRDSNDSKPKNDENITLLYMALDLGSGSTQSYDIANCSLCVYELIKLGDQNHRSSTLKFETEDPRLQMLVDMKNGVDTKTLIKSFLDYQEVRVKSAQKQQVQNWQVTGVIHQLE